VLTFVKVAAVPPTRKPKKPPDNTKTKLLVKPPYNSNKTARTSANVIIIIASLIIYNGKPETTLKMQTAVKDNVRASGFMSTSDFRSATVASNMKTCILGFISAISKDRNIKKKSEPVLPKKGTTKATKPKLARIISLRAVTTFTLIPF
jgi:hypothetical protein